MLENVHLQIVFKMSLNVDSGIFETTHFRYFGLSPLKTNFNIFSQFSHTIVQDYLGFHLNIFRVFRLKKTEDYICTDRDQMISRKGY